MPTYPTWIYGTQCLPHLAVLRNSMLTSPAWLVELNACTPPPPPLTPVSRLFWETECLPPLAECWNSMLTSPGSFEKLKLFLLLLLCTFSLGLHLLLTSLHGLRCSLFLRQELGLQEWLKNNVIMYSHYFVYIVFKHSICMLIRDNI